METNLKLQWKTSNRNHVLSGEDFFISFLDKDADLLMPEFKNKKGGDETALWIDKDKKFYILDGDWRKQYEQAFLGGVVACKKLYDENKKEHRSFWSEDE